MFNFDMACPKITMECYAVIKKKELLPFTTAWMNLENIVLRKMREIKISQDLTQGQRARRA